MREVGDPVAQRTAVRRRVERKSRRRRGHGRVDPQRTGRIVVGRARQIGVVAGAILDRAPVQIEGHHHQVRRVLSGRHGIAERQCAGSGAGCIGRHAAVIQYECRRARDRYGFAETDRRRDHLARVQIAAAVGDPGAGRGDRHDCRRRPAWRQYFDLSDGCLPPSIGDILVRYPERVRIVGIGDRGGVQAPALHAGAVARVEEAAAGLIRDGRAERAGRIAGGLEDVVVRRIHVRAAGGEIDEDVAGGVDGDGGVEGRHIDPDGGAGNVALRHQDRSVGIADVDLEPMNLRHARADRLELAHAVEKAIGVDEVSDPLVAGIQQKVGAELLGGVRPALIDLAETDGARGSERVRGLVVGRQRDDDLAAVGIAAGVVGLAVVAVHDGEDALVRRFELAGDDGHRAAVVEAAAGPCSGADDPGLRSRVAGDVDVVHSRGDVDVGPVDRQHRAVRGGQLTVDRERGVQRGEIPAVVWIGILGNCDVDGADRAA